MKTKHNATLKTLRYNVESTGEISIVQFGELSNIIGETSEVY